MYRYQEKKIIGRGNYGTAVLVRERETGQKYVIKKIPLLSLTEKERKTAESECKLLAKLHHPNIVEYIDSFLEQESLHLVTQYCELGDLAKLISKNKKKGVFFSEKQIIDWFIQIVMAVDHIHSQSIMHRDLKTGNVFLTKTNVVKLGDFGIAKVLDSTLDQANTVVGTPYYLSPEVCENKTYDKKSDMWACGCILYELCTLNHAFDASNLLGLVYKIVQESYPPIPDHYSPELRELVRQLLSKDPAQRPSCRRIFRLPFIKKRLESLAKAASLGEVGGPQQNGKPDTVIPMTVEAPLPPTISTSNGHSHKKNRGALTPSDLIKERKELANKRREKELREATVRNLESREVARRRSEQWFSPSADNVLLGSDEDDDHEVENNDESGDINVHDQHDKSDLSEESEQRLQLESKSSTSSLHFPPHQDVRKLRRGYRDGNSSGGSAEWDESINVGSSAYVSSSSSSSSSNSGGDTPAPPNGGNSARRRSGSTLQCNTENNVPKHQTPQRSSSYQHPQKASSGKNYGSTTSNRSRSSSTSGVNLSRRGFSGLSSGRRQSTSYGRGASSLSHSRDVVPYNHDERPIRASGRYSLDSWDPKQQQQPTATASTSSVGRRTSKKAMVSRRRSDTTPTADEYYSDDFESDESLEESTTPPTPRTQEAAAKVREGEAKDAELVIAECRRRADSESFVTTPSCSSTKSSSSSSLGTKRTGPDWKEIAMKQKLRLKQELGSKLFGEVYAFLKHLHASNADNSSSENQRKLRNMVGKEKLAFCFEVDQLIWIEDVKL